MTIPKVPEALANAVRRGQRFLLTSHINPDGDAIGSEVGLARVLRRLGKSATIWNRDAAPRIYQALPGSQGIHTGLEPPQGFPEAFDAAIVLECPSPGRTGLEEALTQLDVINMDHHLGNEHYGKINWIETAAPAVGEMVFRLAQTMNVAIDQATANALYLTLVTDTGGFRFSNSTPETFEAAAELVRAGASPETVAQWLYESQPIAVLRLLAELLATLEVHGGGTVATVKITQDMMERSGAVAGDSEGLIDYPRSIDGVQAVALFRELTTGETKVSLRSRGKVNVEKIARAGGGGGHHNAAGFTNNSDTSVGASTENLMSSTIDALIRAISDAENDDSAADPNSKVS